MNEYRICWSASSNISFRGETDWHEWDGDEEATQAEIEDALADSKPGVFPQGLEEALEASGLEWWVEVREIAAAGQREA